MNISFAFALAAVWGSVSAAVIYAIGQTGSLKPLWTFLIPALLNWKFDTDNTDKPNPRKIK